MKPRYFLYDEESKEYYSNSLGFGYWTKYEDVKLLFIRLSNASAVRNRYKQRTE